MRLLTDGSNSGTLSTVVVAVNFPARHIQPLRHHLKDVGTVVRTSVYVNPVAHKELTVVTFDDFRGTVRFFNGNISPAELKQVLKRPYTLY